MLPGPRRVLLAFCLVASGCGDAPTGVRDVVTTTYDVTVGSTSRSYRLHVPESTRGIAAPPLLIAFHGANQGAENMELMSWFYPVAEATGLMVAFPQASGDYWNTPNSPPAYWSVADVAFVDALLEDVAEQHGLDRSRVYVTGFSNGAIFAELVACLRGEAVAGLAIVGAGLSSSVAGSCPWVRAIPTVVLFGDSDPQFFWDEGLAAAVGMLGGEGTAAWLAQKNQCDATPTVSAVGEPVDDGTDVEMRHYVGCTGDATVDFYRIVGGGHTWPGSPLNLDAGLGRKTRRIQASRIIADFMLSKSVPAAAR
jgi:polyhydroxybutyrate depolymerase